MWRPRFISWWYKYKKRRVCTLKCLNLNLSFYVQRREVKPRDISATSSVCKSVCLLFAFGKPVRDHVFGGAQATPIGWSAQRWVGFGGWRKPEHYTNVNQRSHVAALSSQNVELMSQWNCPYQIRGEYWKDMPVIKQPHTDSASHTDKISLSLWKKSM